MEGGAHADSGKSKLNAAQRNNRRGSRSSLMEPMQPRLAAHAHHAPSQNTPGKTGYGWIRREPQHSLCHQQ
ncbi:hypothetical protein E2C01_028801 [Portunus trituberculatus]|uniref:Uncharacterized protein n=1 Tax=Portunus trituberculatus TaxID=210409 RepID=A0A5B7ELF1_PORTR|nr:hypothetical protein [Portunus trituberculatus]